MNKAFAILPLLVVVFAPLCPGQRHYEVQGVALRETFDTLNPAFQSGSPHAWTDNLTVPGWYTNRTVYYANSNAAETSRLYNLRVASSSTDQTLGSVPGNASGDIHKAIRLLNATGQSLSSLAIAYDGQQWRNSGNATASRLTVSYRIGGGDLLEGTWTPLPNLTFSALHTGGSAENLNGNMSANFLRLSTLVNEGHGLLWPAGEELWIRWTHANHGGDNHALGLDNVEILATAPFQSAGKRGGWLWRAPSSRFGTHAIVGDPQREIESIELFKAWEIGRIYTSLAPNRFLQGPDELRAWNSRLHQAGIKPHLLYSTTGWLDSENWPAMTAALQSQLIDFNNATDAEAGRFAGLHFDIEPQAHPEWPTFSAVQRREAVEALVLLMKETKRFLQENGMSNFPLSCAIAHWYERLPPALGGTGTIGWASESDRDQWYQRLAAVSDEIVVMAFNLSGSDAVRNSTFWVRNAIPDKVRLSLRVEGAEWLSLQQMIEALSDLEKATGLGLDIQPLYAFAEKTEWRLRPFYADWRVATFDEGALADARMSGPLASPAGDGVTNALRYALGLSAGRVSPRMLPEYGRWNDGGSATLHTLRFRRLSSARDLSYTVLASSDLVQWETLPAEDLFVLENIEAGVEEVVAVDQIPAADAPRRFLRLQVDLEDGPVVDYHQNFDKLDPTFTDIYGAGHAWVDDVTIPGWYAGLSQYFATSNPVEGNRLFNLRSGSSSGDQSLGSVPAATSGDIHKARRLVNDGARAVDTIEIGYAGEQWRDSGNAQASQLMVAYRLGGGGLDGEGWIPVPELTFVAPHTSGTAALLDGSTGSNRRTLSHTLTGLNWSPGQELWLRWTHANHGGMNHGLSLDDVSIRAWLAPQP
jgi:hypothetical protein